MVYEITRDYPLREIDLTTPLEQTTAGVLDAPRRPRADSAGGTGMLGGGPSTLIPMARIRPVLCAWFANRAYTTASRRSS